MPEPRAATLAFRRILVVDDQPSIRNILEAALTDAGAEVVSAVDGNDALRRVQDAPPDLILLDLSMPGLDGWAVLERLRSSSLSHDIPVVLETSADDYPSFARARQSGVAAFLSKPFRLAEVVETCRRILEGARPMQGKGSPEALPQVIELRDEGGSTIWLGRLVESDVKGAQLELDVRLEPGRRVAVALSEGTEIRPRKAEVRWVNRVDGRFRHGLLFRD